MRKNQSNAAATADQTTADPKRDAPKAEIEAPKVTISEKPINLAALLSSRAVYQEFHLWIVGDTPLITHAWSHKAKTEMLQKQVKATKAGKEQRDPEADFVSSLYEMGKDKNTGREIFGFPATGVKNCILASAHKDKGIAKQEGLG